MTRLIRVCFKLKKYGAGKGAWAVVTGASEGIGREYALQLAKKGFNVLVLARNKTALDALVKEIGMFFSTRRVYDYRMTTVNRITEPKRQD